MKRDARLRWLEAQIRGEHYPNAEQMVQELQISRRTAFTDLAYLRDELNAPIVFDKLRSGWKYTEECPVVVPALFISSRDAASLQRAVLVAKAFLTPPDVVAVETIVERMLSGGTAEKPNVPLRETAGGALRPFLSVGLSPALVETCQQAVTERYKMAITYYGAHKGEQSKRTICPYHLHNDRSEYYLIAHCEKREALRTFHLGRIRDWALVGYDAAFCRPPDFDAAALIAQGFHLMHGGIARQEVVVRFSPYQARWIRERQYHETQTIAELANGGLLLRVTVTGLAEIKRWVMSFGREAEVLEPAILREEIAAEFAAACHLYEK